MIFFLGDDARTKDLVVQNRKLVSVLPSDVLGRDQRQQEKEGQGGRWAREVAAVAGLH